jgi:hypothetical protein
MHVYMITKILALTLENQEGKKNLLKQMHRGILRKIVNAALKDGWWSFSNCDWNIGREEFPNVEKKYDY